MASGTRAENNSKMAMQEKEVGNWGGNRERFLEYVEVVSSQSHEHEEIILGHISYHII